ncbi:tRNA (adenosine(37)-N6)-threonylcarbamoyltransferase complex dimerization subunit type 1 TsaB [Actinomyces israelii]|uniref:tRNA (Adenosine(37)-N6)-threonylcarbamoyltransferase complex dimerization subunit type 1 TsaB n=1 Tax=Actinomyces israelii TaxID=1659 RepID=A0ABT4ICK4_9ACTO|nr:tRNA (adenosine(37)-N6)-threonylcarbamoyltransferase complex dimerization subunit type 1 TsaB [Actinomyces israelii]MCZ0859480.1 tRNA (adenosine(37)-N6)-threonylcarbamoyltransferase complex dimerization subunit type 1 TsaB [Actinomyces israelii]
MRIVSIDSSFGSRLLVADADLGSRVTLKTLSCAEQPDSRRHAESLGVMLAEALRDPGVADRGLDAVVAATGPAPFTGLRAGLVTARALGRARGIPVHGVPSLDAVARAAFDRFADGSAAVLVVTDARRREVYAARYRARGADDVERMDEPAVLAPDAAADLDGVDAVAGSGAALYPQIAAGRPVLAPVSGDARAQCRIALARLAAAGPGAVLPAEPLYLRHADVQPPTAPKRVR